MSKKSKSLMLCTRREKALAYAELLDAQVSLDAISRESRLLSETLAGLKAVLRSKSGTGEWISAYRWQQHSLQILTQEQQMKQIQLELAALDRKRGDMTSHLHNCMRKAGLAARKLEMLVQKN